MHRNENSYLFCKHYVTTFKTHTIFRVSWMECIVYREHFHKSNSLNAHFLEHWNVANIIGKVISHSQFWVSSTFSLGARLGRVIFFFFFFFCFIQLALFVRIALVQSFCSLTFSRSLYCDVICNWKSIGKTPLPSENMNNKIKCCSHFPIASIKGIAR